MSSSSSTTYSPITIFHGLGVIEHSKTPITEPSPPYGSTTLQQASISTSLLPDHAIPSLFGYIVVVTNSNGATWSLFSEHQFATIAKHTSIFLVIPFHLKQQAWVRVCVVTVVPITSCFIIPLTWCRRWLTTSAWNLSTIVSWSSSTLGALPGIQLNSWWVIPSVPLDDSCSHRPLYCLPFNTTCSCFV